MIGKYGPDYTFNYKVGKENKSINFKYDKPKRNPMDFKIGSYTFRDPLYEGL